MNAAPPRVNKTGEIMKFAKKSDILLLVALIVICLLIWGIYTVNGNNAVNKHAEIYHDNELIKRIPLTTGQDYTFTLDENPNVVFHVYATGAIAFEQSDCPDKVCIHTGKLSHPGQTAACLPNSLVLKIAADKAETTDDVDLQIK